MATLQAGGEDSAQTTQKLQDVFSATQESVLSFEGTINKFLVDDKGVVLLGAFGLPPLSHFGDDPVRAVMTSMRMLDAWGVPYVTDGAFSERAL